MLFRSGYSWFFTFAEATWFRTDGWWRVMRAGRVLRVSEDHEQWFGLEHPVDLVAELTERLAKTRLSAVQVDDLTGDLALELTSDYVIQIPITSSGYENYEFRLNGHGYVGAGGGVLTIAVPTANPSVREGHVLLSGFGTSSPCWAPR